MSSNSPAPVDPATPADEPAQPTVEASAATQSEGTSQASTADTAARLAELFPALFAGAPKPLKLRIQVDIQERAPGVFSRQALSAFFRRYTGGTSYLIAVSKGKSRFDLDGQPAGELSDEHRKLAAEELARRRANAQARREKEEEGRRQRASLLRDFERTTLTTSNFCALKGIAVDQLDALLAQARTEAQEEAQRPRRPEHGHGGGHGQGRRDGQPHGRPRDGQRNSDRREVRGPGSHPGQGAQDRPERAPNGERRDTRGSGPGPRRHGPKPEGGRRDEPRRRHDGRPATGQAEGNARAAGEATNTPAGQQTGAPSNTPATEPRPNDAGAE